MHDFISKLSAFLFEYWAFKLVFSVFAYFVFQLFGVLNDGHTAVAILIVVDTITGVWFAASRGELRSRKLFRGTFSKVCLYALFVVAIHQIVVISPKFQFLQDWSFLFLGATELLSIVENLHGVGLILPKWTAKYLQKILEKKPTT